MPRLKSTLIALRSLVRGLPLLISARPKTPLRVSCIAAFDTLHRLRRAEPLPVLKVKTLAALLDFAACANAALDNKEYCPHEFQRTLQLLEEAGIRSSAMEYLRRLKHLEYRRPLPGGDCRQFQRARAYREAVVRLSLGMVATTADSSQCLDGAIRATYCESDLNILFRIVMHLQIIDDVLDYASDKVAGLPGFLTTSKPLSQAWELTWLAALDYADDRDLPRTADLFPLRFALFLVSTCTKLVMALARWQHPEHSFPLPTDEPRVIGAGHRGNDRTMIESGQPLEPLEQCSKALGLLRDDATVAVGMQHQKNVLDEWSSIRGYNLDGLKLIPPDGLCEAIRPSAANCALVERGHRFRMLKRPNRQRP